MNGLRGARAVAEAIAADASAGLDAQSFIERTAARVQRVVPADGYFWASADPQTGLCMGAGIVDRLPDEICQPFWDNEFLVPDFNKFADIVAGPSRVVDLHEATGGRPQRSARHREFYGLFGLTYEVRVAFTCGATPWGYAHLNRSVDSPPFSEEEKAWLAAIQGDVARGLRQAMVCQASGFSDVQAPGIVLLEPDGTVVSVSAEAEHWMRELESAFTLPSATGLPIPVEAFTHAQAAALDARVDAGAQPLRARLRTRSGMWLLLHATVMRSRDGEPGHTALVLEPAKASDVAPIVVEAYGLSAREVEVTRLIARGTTTAEIAAGLCLSPHTVRDHIKSIFEKVGVSSRGELVSQLFADHYGESVHAAIGESHGTNPAADRVGDGASR